MIFLSAGETERAFEWGDAIGCIRDAYAARTSAQSIPGRLIAAEGSAWIRCMPAIPATGRYMGTKQISRTREGRLMYVITLFDKQTGELAYLIDAVAITGIRTAATSAVALDLLSADTPLRLAVLGSGLEASKHVEAIAKVRPIASLQVFSPTAANRERFANEWGTRLQVASQAHSSPESAVRGATHVIAAARSRGEQPILRGDWLSAGAVVISIGSTTPSQRELDASVIERAAVIVADVPHELADDTGDMIAATEAAIPFREKLFSLQQLVQGAIPQERLSPDGILLFKSVGSALQDIVFAESVAAAAERKGFGTRLSLDMRIKQSIGKNS